RKLTATVHKSNTILVFINQIRMKIGVMFGSPETTTGGNALKFYASVRLDIRRVGSIKVGEDAIGNRTRVKVVKNKMAPPFLACEFDILFGKGISRSGDVIDLATELKIIDKSGAWYSYSGERIGQGRDNSRVFLEEHPQMLNEIEQRVFEAKGLKRGPAPAAKSEKPAEEKANGKAAAAAEAKSAKAPRPS
ncbi:MAG: recombinase RecA, partial [Polyangiales bacterium]